jgi:hypothetical protein
LALNTTTCVTCHEACRTPTRSSQQAIFDRSRSSAGLAEDSFLELPACSRGEGEGNEEGEVVGDEDADGSPECR